MEKIPELIENFPEQLIDAVNNRELVVFLGAGVSRIIGCKGWDELAQKLLRACLENNDNDGKPYLNFREYDRLKRGSDHKKIITICHDLLKDGGHEDLFYKYFGASLEKVDKLNKDYPIYKIIHKLNAINVTTNADNHYDEFFENRNIKKEPKEFDFEEDDEVKNRFLFKIHGHYDKDNNSSRKLLIFTADRYVSQYNDPDFKKFLSKIFTLKYTVLFIGYGLSEFELIDYLITKANPNKRHYMIKNYFSEEVNLFKYDKMYYSKLQIDVLPYAIDSKGYKQLFYVLEDFVSQINEKSDSLMNRSETLEQLVEAVTKDE